MTKRAETLTTTDDYQEGSLTPPGYRLHRVEVMNWGTFDSIHPPRIHTAEPGGKTSLLIGQNGSGKSTLADSILTLLVPPQTRNYNVAAGSHGRKKERNEVTYIKGAYAHGSSSDDNRAKTKYLRPDGKHFSGLLAYFENAVDGAGFTLAQILWLDPSGRTRRLCCFAKGEIRATAAFRELKLDRIKERLETKGFRVTDNFSTYEKWIRAETGMRAKAMDVFNQTVSVKDIQSLNHFIRQHMLEAKPWQETLDSILSHFDQLSESHRLLIDARRQIEALSPVVELGDDYTRLNDTLREKQDRSEASEAFFRQKTLDLCEEARQHWTGELARLDSTIAVNNERLVTVRERIRILKNDLEATTSDRLRQLPGEIEKAEIKLKSLRNDKQRYFAALKKSGLVEGVATTMQFEERKTQLRRGIADAESQQQSIMAKRYDLDREKRELDEQCAELTLDIQDLQDRATKLPRHFEIIRRRLCEDLDINPKHLLFAAELIAVRPEHRDWEAAAENILRSFGLSLLVPERHYRAVSRYVNSHRIADERGRGQRLVYLRVPDQATETDPGHLREPERRALCHKLEVKPGHPLTGWMRGELTRRANFICCETIEEFQSVPDRAMTRERQVKSGDHHTKDDRPEATDDRNYVLGWNNREKLRLIQEELGKKSKRAEELAAQLDAARKRFDQLTDQLDGMRAALNFENFAAIDTAAQDQFIADLIAEKERLEYSDDRVRTVLAELQSAERQETEIEQEKTAQVEERGGVKRYIDQSLQLLESAREFLDRCREEDKLTRFAPRFEAIAADIGARELTIHNIGHESAGYRRELDAAIAQLQKQLDPIEKKISSAMSRFLREFPGVATSEGLESAPAYLPEFMSVYRRIRADDLPQFESRFRERLRDKVLEEISLFQTMLGNEAEEIKEKIAVLNHSLEKINYDEKEGTVMRLEPLPTRDKEIADFRQQLRDCTAGLLDNTEQALETCYQRVEKLIAALRNENTRWRDKVIDVREWYDFVARESVRETGEERNYHSDSQGQSGGEKAKLAFTILVAAVVYQFDIDPADRRSSRFHFVVVDEMFSKIDDHYATYAMRLFQQFGLQLLIVAPFDAKAKVTEPFVDYYLHVVKKNDRSQVFTMTAEEFHGSF